MEKNYNSSSNYSLKVGGGLPFLVDPKSCQYREGGAEVKNSLDKGEKIAAGTPLKYDLDAHEAKFLKIWKVKAVSTSGDNSTITLYKTAITPKIKSTTVVIKIPETLTDTGKAVAAGTITETDTTYAFTVATANIDTVAADDLICEAAESGSAKGIYCTPNSISTEDIIAGDNYTLVDIPYGIFHAYKNTINPMPDIVKAALTDGILVVWEKFNETNS